MREQAAKSLTQLGEIQDSKLLATVVESLIKTLKEDELQISGLENPVWTPHSDDMWDELCASSKEADDKP